MMTGERLTFLDAEIKPIQELSIPGIREYAITKHFIWVVKNDDALTARFMTEKKHEGLVLNGALALKIGNAEVDEIVVLMKNKVVRISVSEAVDSVFTNLISERKFGEAIAIGEALDLDIPFLFQYSMDLLVKNHDMNGALQILQYDKREMGKAVLRILAEGSDRLALICL
jgi:hypothetical protein